MSGVQEEGSVQELAQETTSYYGWMNVLCYNVSILSSASMWPDTQVGYHNEHHDFPSVPWTNLPALRRIAHEFYDPLPAHTSWPYVTWKFITDPSVGMWSRAKRVDKGEKLDERVWLDGEDSGVELEVKAGMKEAVERGYGSDPEDEA